MTVPLSAPPTAGVPLSFKPFPPFPPSPLSGGVIRQTAPVRWDFSCYTPEEQYELDQLLAKAEARPDGLADLSIYTDDDIDALARLATIHAAHLARGGGAAPGDAGAGAGGA